MPKAGDPSQQEAEVVPDCSEQGFCGVAATAFEEVLVRSVI
jgi:hypothetical protein